MRIPLDFSACISILSAYQGVIFLQAQPEMLFFWARVLATITLVLLNAILMQKEKVILI